MGKCEKFDRFEKEAITLYSICKKESLELVVAQIRIQFICNLNADNV